MTSSLETKFKNIKRTWMNKISWLCNSLLYKARNTKQEGSLIHISSPVNTQSKVQWRQTWEPGKSHFTVKQAFSPTLFFSTPSFPEILSLNCCLWGSIFSTTRALSMKSSHTKGVTNPTLPNTEVLRFLSD